MTIDPGLSWDTNFASYYISVPLRVHQYVGKDFKGSQKNSDYSKAQIQAGITFHIGGKRKPPETGAVAGPAINYPSVGDG